MLGFCIQAVYGQVIRSWSLQLINEQIVKLPFTEQGQSPLHLGGTLSYEIQKNHRKYFRFSHVFQLGYFHHQDLNQVAYLSWKPQFQMRLGNLLELHAIPGLGYAHSFSTQQLYHLENGRYQKARSLGRPHVIPSIGVGFGMDLSRFEVPMEVFFRQEYMVLFPNARRLPISLNSIRGVGLKYFFDIKKDEDVE